MTDDYEELEVDEDEVPDYDDDAPKLPTVAQSEHDLIVMARALVAGPDSNEDIWSLLCASRQVAPKIGPTCARLLEDALRLSWRALWQRGGTRPRTSPSGVKGRLWDRYQPAPLMFSGASLVFLRWLVATPFAAPASTIKNLPAIPLKLGDQLLVYLALDAARATPALRVIAAQPFVHGAPLAWLGFAPYMTGAKPPAFDSLVTGAGPIVVEALSDEIARRWHASELAKRSINLPAELIAFGVAQDAAIEGFFDACDKHKRRDLASFAIDAVAPLLERTVYPGPLLDPSSPLSERANARTRAGSLLRAIVRWSEWDQQHRSIRFIDDEYASAQVMLARFERIGSAGVGRVQGWLAELASLAPSDTVPAGN
jgi:hypothetical protein